MGLGRVILNRMSCRNQLLQAVELTDYQGKKATGATLFEEDLAYTLEPVGGPKTQPRLVKHARGRGHQLCLGT